MLSCAKSNLDVIRVLVQNGANLRLRNKDGWNCFHIAAREGQTNILNYLLDSCTDIWNSCSKNGRTPLHTAGGLSLKHWYRILILLTGICVICCCNSSDGDTIDWLLKSNHCSAPGNFLELYSSDSVNLCTDPLPSPQKKNRRSSPFSNFCFF